MDINDYKARVSELKTFEAGIASRVIELSENLAVIKTAKSLLITVGEISFFIWEKDLVAVYSHTEQTCYTSPRVAGMIEQGLIFSLKTAGINVEDVAFISHKRTFQVVSTPKLPDKDTWKDLVIPV